MSDTKQPFGQGVKQRDLIKMTPGEIDEFLHGWHTMSCATYNHDGSIQNCGWVLFADASHWTIDPATAPEVAAATEPTPADMLSGAAMPCPNSTR